MSVKLRRRIDVKKYDNNHWKGIDCVTEGEVQTFAGSRLARCFFFLRRLLFFFGLKDGVLAAGSPSDSWSLERGPFKLRRGTFASSAGRNFGSLVGFGEITLGWP